MKGWFTAREIAEFSLPGLPQTKRGINKLAQSEGWQNRRSPAGEELCRPRAGGPTEYHISLLPPAARAALSAQATKIDTTKSASLLPLQVETSPVSPAKVLRRDARLALLTLAEAHYSQNRALGRTGADEDFVSRYNRGELQVDRWLLAELPSTSVPSVRRWRRTRDQGRWHAVGGEGRKVSSVLAEAEDGDVAIYIGGLLVAQPFLSTLHVRDLVEQRFSAALRIGTGTIPLPHERTFQRFIVDWRARNAVALQKLTDPDSFKSHSRISGTNAYAGITRLNELWEIDASPADVLLKEGRHAIYALVDIFSRRMMVYVTKTPRTEATLLLLRKAIIAWGVPETLRTDNGSDFTSHAFKRALHALGIMHDLTSPFSPEQKGVVERAIGTLQRDLMPLLPGFIGHSVADRSQIEERKAFAARLGESDDSTYCVDLNLSELQAYADTWAELKYARRTHKALGTTPYLKAQSVLGSIRTITNLRALDLLLSPVSGGWRIATKRGLQLDGGYYISGAIMPGQRVFCRQDPADMGRVLVFADEHGAFICEAICPERAGVDPKQAVAMARAEQSRVLKEGTAEIRAAARAIKPRHMVDAILGLAKDKADQSNITAFPRRQDEHSTDALEHAADATREAVESGFEDSLEGLPSPVEQSFQDPKIHRLPETPMQRFKRALAVKEALAASQDVDAEEVRWFGGYEQTAEYKSQAGMLASFGSQWLNNA